jgi:hypothetical protein
MDAVLNDGYWIPKNPELYKNWYENATYDADKHKPNIPTKEEFDEYVKVLNKVKELSKILKCATSDIVSSVSSIHKETNDLNNELVTLKGKS